MDLDAMREQFLEEESEIKLERVGDSVRWGRVVSTLRKHFHDPDIEAARVLYSAVAAHGLVKGQPVWPMAVAPPGSMKSELITALDGMDNVFLVDAVTPKTFLSGQIPDDSKPATNRSASLLHRIGKSGIILIPDFSTVQSMKADERASVFASLRKIFDGRLSKEFGTAEKVEEWKGRITIVVGTTPEIDRHRAVNQALGERFVMVRWKRAGIEAARRAIVQDRVQAHLELKDVVRDLLTNLPEGDVEISPSWQERIVSLAEIAARGRTHVHRHSNTKDVEEDPQPESATRIAQQLCQLAKGSALVAGRSGVVSEDFAVAKRAGFDSILPRRLEILLAVASGNAAKAKNSTTRYDVEDLREVGLLESDTRLTNECADLFKCIQQADVCTEPPPRSNEGMNRGMGEIPREAVEGGQ